MSSITQTMQVAFDAWTDSARSSLNLSTEKKLGLCASSPTQRAYLYMAKGFPRGANIINAKLRVYTAGAWNTTPTLTVQRITSDWKVGRITHDNAPSSTTSQQVTGSHASNADGDLWEFDVTNILQTIAGSPGTGSGSSPWYGFRISTSGTSRKNLWSADALDFRPTLTVTWSEAPDAPSVLTPGGGRYVSVAKPVLMFDFTDTVGDTTLQAVQVQISNSSAVVSSGGAFSSSTFDSGSVASSVAQLDLSATAYAGITAGATIYWIVRVQDGSGSWSKWSDPTSVTRAAKGTLTITNPAVSPNNFVTDVTPPFAWTFTGETQTQWRLQILDSTAENVLYDSGKQQGAGTSHTPTSSKILKFGKTYTLRLRVWDSKLRAPTTGDGGTADPPYVEATRTFTVNESATVATVTGLSVAAHSPEPWNEVNFSRSTAPDSFTIVRDDGLHVTGIVPSEVFVSGTAYKWIDKQPQRRRSHTYTVKAVVNGVTSASNPSAAGTAIGLGAIWLQDLDKGTAVMLVNAEESESTLSEDGATYTPINAAVGVRITQRVGGLVGTVNGFVANTVGKTQDQWANLLLAMRVKRQHDFVLTIGRETFHCNVFNINVEPQKGPDAQRAVSFEFMQTDFDG